MLYREYPEKSFKSFSLLANALPIGIPAEGLDLGILQPEIGILQPDWYSSDSWGIGFPEGYFSAETFHNAYPSAGMPMGRAFVGCKVSNVTGERLYILQAIHIMDVCDCLASILQMSHEVTLSIK